MNTPNTTPSDREQIEKLCSEMIAERAAQSSALSAQTRAISLGVLALTWLLLNGTQSTLTEKFHAVSNSLLKIAVCCVLALLFDFLQYILALIETQSALHESEKATSIDDAGYDEQSGWRFASHCAFWLKIATTLVAAAWLLILIVARL